MRVNRQHLPVEFLRRGGFLVQPVEVADVLAGFTDDARAVVLAVALVPRHDGTRIQCLDDVEGRQDWLAALDLIEALDPRAVVAGHKRYGNDDSPRIIGETRQYIRDFDRIDKETATAEELYWQMLAIYPDRVNPGALWLSAQSAKA